MVKTSSFEKMSGQNVLVRKVLGWNVLGRNVLGQNVHSPTHTHQKQNTIHLVIFIDNVESSIEYYSLIENNIGTNSIFYNQTVCYIYLSAQQHYDT